MLFDNNKNNDFSNNHKYLTMSQLKKLMRQSNYDLFRPYEIRQKFTEFMFKYKNQVVDSNPMAYENEKAYKRAKTNRSNRSKKNNESRSKKPPK